MTRKTLRFVTWTLTADPDRPPPVRHISCKECGELSRKGTDRETPERWALEHSGRTGTAYRETVSADLITRPVQEREQ
jgi:hypothetical protein